jgi:hypothetical protein
MGAYLHRTASNVKQEAKTEILQTMDRQRQVNMALQLAMARDQLVWVRRRGNSVVVETGMVRL